MNRRAFLKTTLAASVAATVPISIRALGYSDAPKSKIVAICPPEIRWHYDARFDCLVVSAIVTFGFVGEGRATLDQNYYSAIMVDANIYDYREWAKNECLNQLRDHLLEELKGYTPIKITPKNRCKTYTVARLP